MHAAAITSLAVVSCVVLGGAVLLTVDSELSLDVSSIASLLREVKGMARQKTATTEPQRTTTSAQEPRPPATTHAEVPSEPAAAPTAAQSEPNAVETTVTSERPAAPAPVPSEPTAAPAATTARLSREAWAAARRAEDRRAYFKALAALCNASKSGSNSVRQWPQPLRDTAVLEAQRASEASYELLARAAPPPDDAGLGELASSEGLCRDRRWRTLFTGKRRAQPVPVVDLLSGFQGGVEVPLLEVRLHEYAGLVTTVVGEGLHNHRGDKKRLAFPLFNATLFRGFDVEFIMLEEGRARYCEKYRQRIQELRDRTGQREQNEWTLQNNQRACVWQEFAARHPELPGDAVIFFSDLDEFPPVELMAALKFCELSNREGLGAGRPLALQHRPAPYSLRSLLAGCREHTHKQGSVILRAKMNLPQLGYANAMPVDGGVHLTYFGSLPQVLYKGINHAEGGGLISLVKPQGGGVSPCLATEQDFERSEADLRDYPSWIVRHWERRRTPLPKGTPTEATLHCWGVPHFLLRNLWRYPDFAGA